MTDIDLHIDARMHGRLYPHAPVGVCLLDTRITGLKPALTIEEAHPAVVNSVAWQGPEGSHLLASTSADAALLLHDIREFRGLSPYDP